VAAVEASAAALAEAAAASKGGGKKSKAVAAAAAAPPAAPPAAAAAPPAAPPSSAAEGGDGGYSHPACEPLSRHVAFLVSFRAPTWFKKAVGTETVKVRDCHDLVARVDRSPAAGPTGAPAPAGAEAGAPRLETIIMRSQPRLWLPTAGTELKIAEITFDVAVKPEDDEEETDDEGEFSRGVRPAGEEAGGGASTSRSKRRPVANNTEKPTLVMRATVVACCDSMKWLVGLKSTVVSRHLSVFFSILRKREREEETKNRRKQKKCSPLSSPLFARSIFFLPPPPQKKKLFQERIMLYQCEVMASSFIEWVSRRAREEYDGAAPTKPKPPAGPLPPISLPPPLRSLRSRQLSLPGEPSWDGGVHCGGAAGPIGGKKAAAVEGGSSTSSRRGSRAGGSRSAAASRPTSAGGDSVFYDAMDSVPSSPLAVPTPETVAAAQLLGTQLSLSSSGAKHARDEAEAVAREREEEAAKAGAAAAAAKATANQRISTRASSASCGPSKLGPKTRQGLQGMKGAPGAGAGAGAEASAASADEHASKKGRLRAAPTKGGSGGSGSKLVRSFKKMWTSGEQQQQQETAAAGSVEVQ